MSEIYQFVWGEVTAIREACDLVRNLDTKIVFAHIETENYDLDIDRQGIAIRIPHDPKLDENRR